MHSFFFCAAARLETGIRMPKLEIGVPKRNETKRDIGDGQKWI